MSRDEVHYFVNNFIWPVLPAGNLAT